MHLLLHPQLFPAFAFTPSTLKGRESFSSRRGRDHCCLAVFSHYSPSSSLDRILGAPPRRTPRLYFQVKITCVTHSHTDALPSASLQKSLSGKSVRSQAAKRETKSKRIIIFVCIIWRDDELYLSLISVLVLGRRKGHQQPATVQWQTAPAFCGDRNLRASKLKVRRQYCRALISSYRQRKLLSNAGRVLGRCCRGSRDECWAVTGATTRSSVIFRVSGHFTSSHLHWK
jgi:hypothetical protein